MWQCDRVTVWQCYSVTLLNCDSVMIVTVTMDNEHGTGWRSSDKLRLREAGNLVSYSALHCQQSRILTFNISRSLMMSWEMSVKKCLKKYSPVVVWTIFVWWLSSLSVLNHILTVVIFLNLPTQDSMKIIFHFQLQVHRY